MPLAEQRELAASHWDYKWGAAPYGTPSDRVGVLQVVNGGSAPMWIRFAGKDLSAGGLYDWGKYIETASPLNGGVAHPLTRLNTHGLQGQGDGFKLLPGECAQRESNSQSPGPARPAC